MAFPSKGFVFLILLGLGDQENVAVFPELLQGWSREEAVGGLCGVQHLDRELTVVRGQGQLPAG